MHHLPRRPRLGTGGDDTVTCVSPSQIPQEKAMYHLSRQLGLGTGEDGKATHLSLSQNPQEQATHHPQGPG